MNRYFTLENLWRAAALGILSTAMAVPRLSLTGMANGPIVATTALGMVLVAGAVTAWGDAAGMVGCWPAGRIAKGMVGGVMAGLLAALMLRGVDAEFRQALSDPAHAQALELAFPRESSARVASVLWTAGLEVLLFEAGPVSYFARLTRSRGVAVAATALLRGLVAYRQAVGHHIAAVTMVPGHVGLAAVGAGLFAWAGLPAVSAFASVVTLRLFW